ncbi:MAG: PDZ domain-containing protein [Acidobacteria bacterium]|nr:PDZ domain-containing protein [Acidobacteriota bacterium]
MTRRTFLLMGSGLLTLFVSLYVPASWVEDVYGAPSQTNIGVLAFGLSPQDGRTVCVVYQGSPAQEAGLRTGDVIMEIDGIPIPVDRGGTPGTVAKVTVRRGEQNLSFEITRSARIEINWGSGVFHADREKVWRALILALTDPGLSQIFRVRQPLKDEGVVFFDRSGPLGYAAEDLNRGNIVHPDRGMFDILYAVWITPSLRVRELSGATLVEVTMVIEYKGLRTIASGTARSAGGLEGQLFAQICKELVR